MAKGQGGGQRPPNDGMWAIAAFACIAIVLAWLLWTRDRKIIVLFSYGIDYIQYLAYHSVMYVVGMFTPYGNADHIKWMHYVYKVLVGTYDPKTVSFEEFTKTNTDIGQRVSIVYLFVIGFMAWKVKERMLGDGLKRSFSLIGGKGRLSFIEYQSKFWTDTKFAVGFDPEKCSEKYKAPIRPIPFLLKHDVSLKDGVLDKEKINAIALKQLGPLYPGFAKCPFYIKAFLTMCMATIQHADNIDKYRAKLNNAFYDKKATPAEIKENVMKVVNEMTDSDPKMIPKIEELIREKHAYLRSACLGIIGWCGPFRNWGGGFGQIIAPSMYQWLMTYDRTLFMALQSHGKFGICAYPEGAGVVAHYRYETDSGSPSKMPVVERASDGFEALLRDRSVTDFDAMLKSWSSIERRY